MNTQMVPRILKRIKLAIYEKNICLYNDLICKNKMKFDLLIFAVNINKAICIPGWVVVMYASVVVLGAFVVVVSSSVVVVVAVFVVVGAGVVSLTNGVVVTYGVVIILLVVVVTAAVDVATFTVVVVGNRC